MEGRFRISPERMREPISTFRDVSARLTTNGDEILEISQALDSSYVMLEPVLEKLAKETYESANKMQDLGDGLELITNEYVKCEQGILGNSGKGNNIKLSANSAMAPIVGPSKLFEIAVAKYIEALERWGQEHKKQVDEGTAENLKQLQEHLNDPSINWEERDYTDIIDAWLKEREEEFDLWYYTSILPLEPLSKQAKVALYIDFFLKVRTGGEMDIKQSDSWEKAFGFKSPKDTDCKYFLYHGQVMDPGTLGNVLYAYVGAKYFSDFELYSGGAAVQIKNRYKWDMPWMYGLPDWGDMPEDHEAIELGIKWRKEGLPG